MEQRKRVEKRAVYEGIWKEKLHDLSPQPTPAAVRRSAAPSPWRHQRSLREKGRSGKSGRVSGLAFSSCRSAGPLSPFSSGSGSARGRRCCCGGGGDGWSASGRLRGGGCSGSSSGCCSPSSAAVTPGFMILLLLRLLPGGLALSPRAEAPLPCNQRRGRRRGGGRLGSEEGEVITNEMVLGVRRRIRFSVGKECFWGGAAGSFSAPAIPTKGGRGGLCAPPTPPPPLPPLRRLWLAGLAVDTSPLRCNEVRLVCGAS